MPDFIFNPYLFLRTPALSFGDYKSAELSEAIKTPFFQSAIFFASESLYAELSINDFDFDRLGEKVKCSLLKYFNRMCYRPTPFGMFSAFSSLSWGAAVQSAECILDDRGEVYVNPDFQFTAELARRMEKSGEFRNVKYFPNRTIYGMKREKRYLTERFDHKKKKTEFFINSFETNRVLNGLLSFCRQGRTKAEMILWLNEFVDDADDAKLYLDDLVREGLLVTELYPNMTGEKYFDRLVAIAAGYTGTSELAREVLDYRNLVSEILPNDGLRINDLADNILYAQLKNKFKSLFYVSYEKKISSPLPALHQETIRDGLRCLTKIAPETSTRSLNSFIGRFRSRFEDQEVPLLYALDREAGVGYDGLEANLITSELLDGIQLDLQLNTLNFSWTPVHEFFLSKLVAINANEPIFISDEELEKLQNNTDQKMPPSFSVIFRLHGDKIWIEQAGGCTATSLLGRFSLFSEDVLNAAKNIAATEEQSNNDVIFAEISCFNDEHAANINVNAGIRAFEIPIGAHSTYPGENIISLSDLVVSVEGDHIRLRSKKLNKIVIPRLSSAYNYSRSELTVFRFLCDLQYQGLKFNYNFDLRLLLPGLSYYPRVEYKKCILYPATWILHDAEITEMSAGFDRKSKFCNVSKKIGLKRQFALTEGDNQLIFDQDDTASVDLFLTLIKGKTLVVLTEVYVDQPSPVVDQAGKGYVGQFIASVFTSSATYPYKTLAQTSRHKNKVKRIYLPGDEWLYFKLYCHSSASNGILIRDIQKITKQLNKQGILISWFFIRYADPDHHLRIRVKINPDDGARVVLYFEKKMRSLVERGSISNLLLDTYKREIERYGEGTIDYAELVFNASSELILNYLKSLRSRQTDFSEFHFAVISVDALLEIFFPENAGRLGLVKLMHEGMKREFDDSKQVKFQLDNKYREYAGFFNSIYRSKPAIVKLAGKKQFGKYISALQLLKSAACDCPEATTMKLAGDLIHMHLNRLFSDKQRNHEYIIYYLLYKYYTSAEARRGKELLSFSPAFKRFGVHEVEKVVFK
ncbi:MAG TPA: lantibiotic dehydratase [Mucilaginibacter sp.]|jgi:thiopeptide-type bacteriocin biosynthesis protein|nr:lantibiotic dehydratase [Mucilaginibacter sp.]